MVGSFLYDLSVRHLLISDDSFDVESKEILKVLDLEKFLSPDAPEIQQLLSDRPAVHFKPLDRSTGEFISTGTKGEQVVSGTNEKFGITLEATIPEVVQGLYWRSPAHLELQFYKGHAIAFHLSGKKINEYQERLDCVSLTARSARATTTDPAHRYLLNLFDRCP